MASFDAKKILISRPSTLHNFVSVSNSLHMWTWFPKDIGAEKLLSPRDVGTVLKWHSALLTCVMML